MILTTIFPDASYTQSPDTYLAGFAVTVGTPTVIDIPYNARLHVEGSITISGDTYIRKTTVDTKSWQILNCDGKTPVDISGFLDLEILMTSIIDGTTKTFKYSDVPSKVSITDSTTGQFTFSPSSTDFTSDNTYKFHILVVDSEGDKAIPEDREYYFYVR